MIREVLNLRRMASMSPEDAAAMWIARRSGGVMLDAEPGFGEWLGASESHRQALEEAEAALRPFDDNDDDELLLEMRRAALAKRPDRRWRWASPAAIAASLALVVSAGLLLRDQDGSPPDPVIVQANNPLSRLGSPDFVTAKGEQKEISLSDGSRLTLDTDSVIDVALSPERRTLVLSKGRALFDVHRDPNRPFEVRAGDREVVALGTQFEVRVDPGQVRVTLFKGRVAVSPVSGGTAVRLKAGEQFLQRGLFFQVTGAAPVKDSLAWRRGLIIFEDETLEAAVAELNRYSVRPLVIHDRGIARMRISGAFVAGDPARFARTITAIHPVRISTREDGAIELSPQGR